MEKSNVKTFVPKETKSSKKLSDSLSPREIVSELDRFVVGQNNAKKAVEIKTQEEMSKLTGDLKLPPGMKFPF